MTVYIFAVVMLLVLLCAPWIVWYASPYEREFRRRRRLREELRRLRTEGYDGRLSRKSRGVR